MGIDFVTLALAKEYVKEETIPVPATAQVGQVLSVKSVDETGKPTEWEAVDAPEGGSNQPLTFTGAVNATYDGSEAVTVNIPSGGGGESEWVELVNVTLEEAASFDQTVDYSYNEYILAFVVPKDTTTLSSGRGAFLGVKNVLYYQNIASNASYAFKFIAHGRKITDNTMIASLVKVMQNGSQIDNSIHQGSSYVIAPTLVEHSNGRMYIEGALPAGTVIVIYAR